MNSAPEGSYVSPQRRRSPIRAALAGGVCIVLGWELLARLVPLRDPQWASLLPRVAVILSSGLAHPEVLRDAAATAIESLLGMLLGGAFGTTTGVLLVRFRQLRDLFYPWLLVFKAIPLMAFSYILVSWFGNGLGGKVLMCATICFVPMAVAVVEGADKVDRCWVRLFDSYGATATQRLFRLELPAAVPDLLGALKLTAALSVIGAFVAELAGADVGLGARLVMAQQQFNLPLQFVVIINTAFIALPLYGTMAMVQKRFQPRFLSNPRDMNAETRRSAIYQEVLQ